MGNHRRCRVAVSREVLSVAEQDEGWGVPVI
jgi:hypothetical protein